MFEIRAEHIVKQYPGCRALDDVSVSFSSGKIHALLGKNGSGKSTLIKILSGAILPTSGEVFLDGKQVRFSSPSDAHNLGISTVYQEMSLIPTLSVAENIFLGRMPKKNGIIDWGKVYSDTETLLNRMNINSIKPKDKVGRLSLWQTQIVEIAKAMSTTPRVLILDEPTSALASSEIGQLFQLLRILRDQDVVIIYISHKLQELSLIADTVTVLRDGQFVGSRDMQDLTSADIVSMMFGKVEIRRRPQDIVADYSQEILRVENLTCEPMFRNVNFSIFRGEVLGLAGMLGSGRTEILRGIFGASAIDSGKVYVNGKLCTKLNPVQMKKKGLGLTPEDRKTQGLILSHSVKENLCYASLNRTSKFGFQQEAKRKEFVEKQINDLEIKLPSAANLCSSLSGGNQQKVVIGNWLNTSPSLMLYDEPSRGIDVNAKQQIFEIMWEQARKGISTLFVSMELEELMEVCHRILIIRHGEVICEVRPEETTVEALYEVCMRGEEL